jgi:tetratricopeptide (TPR) repeat protein
LTAACNRLALSDGTRSIDATIELSYALLTSKLHGLFAVLAVFRGSFEGAAAQAIWQLDAETASDALGALLRYSLLQWDDKICRYSFHDLIRDFAESRLPDEERAQAQRRHAIYYREVVVALDAEYQRGKDHQITSTRRFDQEWQNVRAAFVWSQSQQDAAAIRLHSDYLRFGNQILALRQAPRERIAWLLSALAASRRISDRNSECSHLYNLGKTYLIVGEARKALDCFDGCWRVAQDIKDRGLSGRSIGGMGIANIYIKEILIAVEELNLWRLIAEDMQDVRAVAAATCNLGLAFAQSGNLALAIEHMETALAIVRDIGDLQACTGALRSLAMATESLGDFEGVMELLEEHIGISQLLGDRIGESMALGQLSRIYRKIQKSSVANELLDKCRLLLAEAGSPTQTPLEGQVSAVLWSRESNAPLAVHAPLNSRLVTPRCNDENPSTMRTAAIWVPDQQLHGQRREVNLWTPTNRNK